MSSKIYDTLLAYTVWRKQFLQPQPNAVNIINAQVEHSIYSMRYWGPRVSLLTC